MSRADFARTELGALSAGDLRFLVQHSPSPGRTYAEIAAVVSQLQTTLESMLESGHVFQRTLDRGGLLVWVARVWAGFEEPGPQ